MAVDEERTRRVLAEAGLEMDPVIEAYKKDVDRTLLRENLNRSVEQRLDNVMAMQGFVEAVRRAGKRSSP
jgi:hypothetical protein